MTGIAGDICSAVQTLSLQRSGFEPYWDQARRVAAPEAADIRLGWGSGIADASVMNTRPQRALAAEESKRMFDSTAVWCVDRLASGLEALIIPQSDYWHSYSVRSYKTEDLSQGTKQFLERLRNLTFDVRNDARSGWEIAAQTALRRMIVFGNAFIEVVDGVSRETPIRYRYIPLPECYAAEDRYGDIDTFYRVFRYTAHQAMQEYGDRCSDKVKKAANSPTDKFNKFTFVQCIRPRADYGKLGTGSTIDSKFASIHIEYASQTVVRESGYYSFPIVDFRWMPEPGNVWAEGPVMRALADIQSLNVLAKNELVGSNQAANPTLLMANAGVMNRPNNTPGKLILGGLSAQGEPLVKPMFTGQRLDFATEVMNAKREQVKESLYINLFALLIKNPQMSATEAMIRSNEKGELLGPCGARIQQSLAGMNERELDIFGRQGVFASNSAYRLPPELHDKNVKPHFTSPLDRYRKGREVEGTLQLLNTLSPLAQVNPEVVDNFEDDKMTTGLAERLGVPAAWIRSPDKVAEIRANRQQAQQVAQSADTAQKYAAASQAGVGALAQAKTSGLI